MNSPIVLICLVVGSILAAAGLLRPFLGLLVLVVIHFTQPTELVPALAPFRIELVYGVLLIARIVQKRISQPGPSIFSDKVFRGALVLLGACVLSLPFSVWRGGTADTVIEVAKNVTLIALLAVVVDSQSHLRQLLWCITGVATWFAGSSLSAFASGDVYTLHYNLGALDRLQGINSIVGNPNELAGLLLALIPISIALLRSTRNTVARILILASVAGSLAAISLTGSRIAIVGLLAIAMYYSLISKHKVLTAVACIIIALIIWQKLPQVYQERYLTVESYAEGGQLDDSNQLRLELWRFGARTFLRRPIFGVGAGQFPIAYGLWELQGIPGPWMNPHNLLIEVACELGIVGLVAFGYFLWQIRQAILFVVKEKTTAAMQLNYQAAIACSVMFFGVIIISIVSHTLYRPYWYLLAGIVAANRNITSRVLADQEASSDVEPQRVPERRMRLQPSLVRVGANSRGARGR